MILENILMKNDKNVSVTRSQAAKQYPQNGNYLGLGIWPVPEITLWQKSMQEVQVIRVKECVVKSFTV